MNRLAKNKKAFELSINFIVMFILAMVIFGIGLYFAKIIFEGTFDIGKDIEGQIRQQLAQKLRDPSAKVAIDYNYKIIYRGKHDYFGIGVTNREESADFYVNVKYAAAQDLDGNPITAPNDEGYTNWIIAIDDIIHSGKKIILGEIIQNENNVEMIPISIPKDAASGIYVFNVQVYKETEGTPEKYDFLQKIRVEVP